MTIERPMFPPVAESSVVEFPKKPIKSAKRKSALVGIRRSGLDLVPSKKTPKDEIATQEQCASLKFRALRRSEKAMDAWSSDRTRGVVRALP